MGTPKALLAWGGVTLIESQVRSLREAGADPVIVVLGHGADQIAPLVKGETVVVNEGWIQGRASSLRAGAEAVPNGSGAVVVVNVDQPRSPELLRRLLQEHAAGGALITQPTYRGKRGHPVVLDSELVPELRNVEEETQGLRSVIQRHASQIREVDLPDEAALLDINTPEEYEEAVAYFQKVSR